MVGPKRNNSKLIPKDKLYSQNEILMEVSLKMSRLKPEKKGNHNVKRQRANP